MSAADNLHPRQFKNYRPAQEEGREASEWLATDEGHAWQDTQAALHGSYAGLTTAPWISLKGGGEEDETLSAESTTGHNWTHGWFPREMTPERKANFESARYG